MKELFRSKKFRTNLYKWLFMYAGVMLLLTTVITYSKYMSGLQVSDEARNAKFNLGIEAMCPGTTSNCNAGSYLVGNEAGHMMEYYFTLDPNELEVKAEITRLVVELDSRFVINKIENIEIFEDEATLTPKEKILETVCSEDSSTPCNSKSSQTGISTYSFKPILIELNNHKPINYKITIEYVGEEITDVNGISIDKIILIDYIAEQTTK